MYKHNGGKPSLFYRYNENRSRKRPPLPFPLAVRQQGQCASKTTLRQKKDAGANLADSCRTRQQHDLTKKADITPTLHKVRTMPTLSNVLLPKPVRRLNHYFLTQTEEAHPLERLHAVFGRDSILILLRFRVRHTEHQENDRS